MSEPAEAPKKDATWTATTRNVERWTAQRKISRALSDANWPKAIFEGQVFAESSGHIGQGGSAGESSIIQIMPGNLEAYNKKRKSEKKDPVTIVGEEEQHNAIKVAAATTLHYAKDYLNNNRNQEAIQAGGYENTYLRLQYYNAGTPGVNASLGTEPIPRYNYPAKVAAYLLFKAEQYENSNPTHAQEYRNAYEQIRDGAIKADRKETFDAQTKALLRKEKWLDNKMLQDGAIEFVKNLQKSEAPLTITESQDFFVNELKIDVGGVDGIVGTRTRKATEIVETALMGLGHITTADQALDPATRTLLAKSEIKKELAEVFSGISGGTIDRSEVLEGVAPLATEIREKAAGVVSRRSNPEGIAR